MVNVPGRSKGCNTCRRRKKGCDLRRPSCARCVRDGFQCEGYDRPTIFVSHQPDTNSTRLVTVRPRAGEWRLAPQDTRTPSPAKQQGLARGALQEAAISEFFNYFFPRDDFLPRAGVSNLGSYSWMNASLNLSPNSLALRQALCALGLASTASQTGDKKLIRQGAEYYGAALARLNYTLQNPQAAANDESVLPTSMLLAVYEQFNGFDLTLESKPGRNWLAHVAGFARLIELRGPKRHTTGHAHALFTQCRVSIFCSCFSKRKGTVFQSDEWRSIPWMERPKSRRDQIFDILILVPGALEVCDTALAGGSDGMCVDALAKLIRIRRIFETWKSSFTTMLWNEEAGSGAEDDAANAMDWAEIHPEFYMRHGVDIASWVMLYWTCGIAMGLSMRALSGRVPAEFRVDTFAGDAFDPYYHAQRIIECVPYFLQPDTGLIGFQNVALPVGVCLAYFAAFSREEPEERKIIRSMMLDSSKVGPYGPLILQFLRQMEDQALPPSDLERMPSGGYDGARWKCRTWLRIGEK
ncbi:hypothetical protein NA57DRAFT_52102 [Rhizodiscina lignyota]|uniref:Zn(2)-C6 fungal-type domain-containing protein n=1 Tax=Rhizodiscina lignyota TaxID=1504668 RepID=A0A9P4MEE6_9PEZI|nr:hypothetical protein NA57DRAFT_52102 [Rhizodiscina lignyota]